MRDGVGVCLRGQSDKHAIETVLPNGLVVGHAYSITAVKEVSVSVSLLYSTHSRALLRSLAAR